MNIEKIGDSEKLQTLLNMRIAIDDLRYSINCNTTEYFNEDDLILLLRSFVQIY